MKLNEVDIKVKHSGLLEVPAGKEVDQLPQSHFQKLIDKKGYEAIIRGLTNLEVWNKNKNPKLSQWASNMADKLKVANKKDESWELRKDDRFKVGDTVYLDDSREVKILDVLHKKYLVKSVNSKNNNKFLVDKSRVTTGKSESYLRNNESYTIHNVESLKKAEEIVRKKLNPKNLRIEKIHGLFYDGNKNIAQYGDGSKQLAIFESYSTKLCEAASKLAKKIGDRAVSGLKKVGTFAKENAKKSVDPARNALVAGAVAPVGAAIGAKLAHRDMKKEKKYSPAEVAAIVAAMKNHSESLSQKLANSLAILEKATKDKKPEESGLKKVAKGAATGAGAGLALGTAGGAALGHTIGKTLTGGLRGKVAGGLVGAAANGVRALTTGAGAGVGAILGVTRGAAGGALAAGGKHLYDKHQASKKNESLIEALNTLKAVYEDVSSNSTYSFSSMIPRNELLIEALDRLKCIYEEENAAAGDGAAKKPRKKRILTPEQKARRQERRKIRRQLKKQGLYVPKKKGGAVSTTKIDTSGTISAGAKKLGTPAKTTGNPKPGNPAPSNPAPGNPKPGNPAPSNPAPGNPKPTINGGAKKLSNATKNTAKNAFKRSQAYKKLMNKAAFKGGLKGAAITAGLGAAGLAAKKLYDKNKKRK